MNLTDKKAVVTGSGQGIGKANAVKLAERGADMTLPLLKLVQSMS